MSDRRITALALAALLALGSGASALHAQGSQQKRMTTCNSAANARHLMGSERRDFMRSCLSGPGHRQAKLTAQQRKMRTCNAAANAKGLKGAERKRYMSTCLKRD
ncbi:MAG TPA: PsiF family protein [Steroidobacteraceae bacterium]|nr:PsiF family protein [Steroidobacteraceae bacterium]